MQERALGFGFRPGNPAVAIQSTDAGNPFVKYQHCGVKLEIPPVAAPPEGAVLRSLVTMWSRVIPKR